ncbi:MAG: tyrosine-type recombinase/integrase [Candidatus Limivicinus sp.]|nr:tyrosine-type recombinase/integrase [Candidatus Limivicinus sp.]
MKISTAAKEYLIEIEVRKFTPKTIRSYRNNLNLFLRFCEEETDATDVEDLSLAVVRQFSLYMSKRGRKGSYINGLLKVAKSFIQYCYEEEYGGFNTKKNFKWCKQDKAVIMAFKPSDVRQMLKSCRGGDYLNIRDAAILTMLFETGVRCWELCCIQKKDIHDDFIIINGKNHKQRVVPITPVLRKALLKYDTAKENYFAFKNIDDYYFLSFHGRQLTNSAIEHVVKRHGEGITDVRVSPHTCRHFYAQQQIKMGTDLYTISRLLGHENIQITQTYLNSLRDDDVINIAKQRSVLMSM